MAWTFETSRGALRCKNPLLSITLEPHAFQHNPPSLRVYIIRQDEEDYFHEGLVPYTESGYESKITTEITEKRFKKGVIAFMQKSITKLLESIDYRMSIVRQIADDGVIDLDL